MTVYRYPPDLSQESRKLPFVKFQMVKFRERNFEYDGKGNITGINPTKIPLDTIVLPLPEEVSNNYRLNWEMTNLQGLKAVEELFTNNSAFRAGANPKTRENMAALLAGNFSKIIAQRTPNPKKQALFNGIEPRAFSFKYTFAPQSLQEAQQVQKIIEVFTINSLPALESENENGEFVDDETAAFYKFPSEFEITFKEVQGYPVLSTCVCTDISTNFSPSQLQLLESGHSVQTTLNITFLETELLRKTKPGI